MHRRAWGTHSPLTWVLHRKQVGAEFTQEDRRFFQQALFRFLFVLFARVAMEAVRSFSCPLVYRNLPKDALSGVRVAVFGLGDSSYAKYNAAARKLHARLLQLGATELVRLSLSNLLEGFRSTGMDVSAIIPTRFMRSTEFAGFMSLTHGNIRYTFCAPTCARIYCPQQPGLW